MGLAKCPRSKKFKTGMRSRLRYESSRVVLGGKEREKTDL